MRDPSINLTATVDSSDTFAKMMRKAKLKRQEADSKFDNLVEMLVTKFS